MTLVQSVVMVENGFIVGILHDGSRVAVERHSSGCRTTTAVVIGPGCHVVVLVVVLGDGSVWSHPPQTHTQTCCSVPDMVPFTILGWCPRSSQKVWVCWARVTNELD